MAQDFLNVGTFLNKLRTPPGTRKAVQRNLQTIRYFEQRMMLVCMGLFKFDGFPKNPDKTLTVSKRLITEFLYMNGQIGFFNDDLGILRSLPTSGGSFLNMYGEPSKWTMVEQGGACRKFERTNGECVIMRLQQLRNVVPMIDYVRYFTGQFAEIFRTIDQHLQALRLPYVLKGSKDTLLTIRNFFKDVKDFEDSIALDSGFKGDVELFDNGMHGKTYLPELAAFFDWVQAQCLLGLGINNQGTEKKERMLVGEVSANNQFTELNCKIMLDSLQEACEDIGTILGHTGITVEIRADNPAPYEEGANFGLQNGNLSTNTGFSDSDSRAGK